MNDNVTPKNAWDQSVNYIKKLKIILGQPGHNAHRLVLKTEKPSSLILPDKLQKDY